MILPERYLSLQAAIRFLRQGATIIVPARDIVKAKRNLEGIAGIEIAEMDLTDPHSVNAFAEKFLASGRPLDLLISNAGIMFVPFRLCFSVYHAAGAKILPIYQVSRNQV